LSGLFAFLGMAKREGRVLRGKVLRLLERAGATVGGLTEAGAFLHLE
jgi:hypothetical protein